MKTSYDLDKIKFATDAPTLKKAMGLYTEGKVIKFSEEHGSFSATVLGSKPYQVSVSARHYDEGFCSCYLGQNDTLCKHLVALAICAARDNKPLIEKDAQIIQQPICSGKLGTLNKTDQTDFKKSTSSIIQKYIKAYEGPSRTWFRYQNKLDEGCNRLSAIVSELPVSQQTADLLIAVLLKLDKKLTTGGIDDSNGTVGNFIQAVVEVLINYYNLDNECGQSFLVLRNQETCFGWEEPLLKIINKQT